jgi:hypothetical protein
VRGGGGEMGGVTGGCTAQGPHYSLYRGGGGRWMHGTGLPLFAVLGGVTGG